jgi:carbonic anhydrase/acetyltransferase-like protein (isoleucine patch superfamily)
MTEKVSFLLFDFGMPEKGPGFDKESSFSGFPVLGCYSALDIALANTHIPSCGERFLFFAKDSSKTATDILARWDTEVYIEPIGPSLKNHEAIIKEVPGEIIVLYDISSIVSLVDRRFDETLRLINKGEILKLSVLSTPVDIYVCRKKDLLSMLKTMITKGPKSNFKDFFNRLFLDFTEMSDVPGVVFFQNSLQNFFNVHLQIISDRRVIHPQLTSTPPLSFKESSIGKGGKVTNSLISPGVKIDGSVVNSFIFHNVSIRDGAKIENSIILPGNSIAKDSRIKNTLVFPYEKELLTGSTIAENTSIGGRSKVSNKDYPEEIQSGLTVIGMNPEIPSGCVIEPGCYVGPNVSRSSFRKTKTLRRGSSLVN